MYMDYHTLDCNPIKINNYYGILYSCTQSTSQIAPPFSVDYFYRLVRCVYQVSNSACAAASY